MSRISLLLHEFEAELRASINNYNRRHPTSKVGFNWLISQCFDLSCFLSKLCVGMHINMF